MKFNSIITKKSIQNEYAKGNTGRIETVYKQQFEGDTIQAAVLNAAKYAEFDPSYLQYDQDHNCFLLSRMETENCTIPNPNQEELWKKGVMDLYSVYYFVEVEQVNDVAPEVLKYIKF